MNFTIRDLMTDPALFGDQFGGESWAPWRALLAGFYGLPLTDEELPIWAALTSTDAPEGQHDELWLVVGRRGGKSQSAALLAVYEACFRDHRARLSPGEVATIRVMAADKAQARTVMRYIIGLIESNAMLQRMVVSQGRESIELDNRTVIEVGTASFRSARGYTYAAIIGDEIAYWRSDDSANPDYEILAAVRPGLATLNGKLIALSSPYARRGELYRTHQKHYGKPGPVLVAQAPSLTMNPSLPVRVVNDAMERDPAAARAEYLAQFRDDLEAFVSRETVLALVRPSPEYNLQVLGRQYFGFVDPSGGGADEFVVCIGHRAQSKVVVDVLQGRKGKPSSITREYAELLKSYGIRMVQGDRYAGSWPADEFAKHGITYRPSAAPKSDLYLNLLPALNSGRVELPPDDKLVNQLSALERRTARGGRDSIDHPPGGHDDRANAVAGLVAMASRPVPKTETKRLKYL